MAKAKAAPLNMEDLPYDALEEIFEQLSMEDLLSMRASGRKMRDNVDAYLRHLYAAKYSPEFAADKGMRQIIGSLVLGEHPATINELIFIAIKQQYPYYWKIHEDLQKGQDQEVYGDQEQEEDWEDIPDQGQDNSDLEDDGDQEDDNPDDQEAETVETVETVEPVSRGVAVVREFMAQGNIVYGVYGTVKNVNAGQWIEHYLHIIHRRGKGKGKELRVTEYVRIDDLDEYVPNVSRSLHEWTPPNMSPHSQLFPDDELSPVDLAILSLHVIKRSIG